MVDNNAGTVLPRENSSGQTFWTITLALSGLCLFAILCSPPLLTFEWDHCCWLHLHRLDLFWSYLALHAITLHCSTSSVLWLRFLIAAWKWTWNKRQLWIWELLWAKWEPLFCSGMGSYRSLHLFSRAVIKGQLRPAHQASHTWLLSCPWDQIGRLLRALVIMV